MIGKMKMPIEDQSNMRSALMAEIVDITGICNSSVPDREIEFWSEMAIWKGLSPGQSAVDNARRVIEALGESWDEDFTEDDGQTPTFGALEAVHQALRQSRSRGADNAEESASDPDEEDDDSGFEALGAVSVNDGAWNVCTVMDFIKTGRIVLNPEWQRSFVWKPKKQRALIESMLYGLPVPSFLLYKDAAGKLFVIDGRQRLETISRFTSPREARGERRIRFKTFSARQDGWKPGEHLNSAANKFYEDLPDNLKTAFDTQTLRVAILDVNLDQLYQIFKRYNTGAVALNAAELRNAVYQSTPLHEFMFRLAGEHRDPKKYKDDEEKRVAEDLRQLMRNKALRYGAYDFLGRFFAFKHESTGSVAKATNSFMHREANSTSARLETFRKEFMAAFDATVRWYDYPLSEPHDGGQFHAWLATIQMVASDHCLSLIADRVTDEATIGAFISTNWNTFASNQVLLAKQNSTNFWKFQKMWIDQIEVHAQSVNPSLTAG